MLRLVWIIIVSIIFLVAICFLVRSCIKYKKAQAILEKHHYKKAIFLALASVICFALSIVLSILSLIV